jgi:hypothetical protein
MSLRRQLIALFAALAVVPLLLVGLLDYVRSIHAFEDVIASNTALIAEQAAADLGARFAGPAANLALLAEITTALAILDSARSKRAPDTISLAYLRRLRDVTRKQFAWIVYPTARAYSSSATTNGMRTWVSRIPRNGPATPQPLTRRETSIFWDYTMSPDGKYVAVPAEKNAGVNLWRIDLRAARTARR